VGKAGIRHRERKGERDVCDVVFGQGFGGLRDGLFGKSNLRGDAEAGDRKGPVAMDHPVGHVVLLGGVAEPTQRCLNAI